MMERFIELRPAYDKRHHDPRKNYGIHGVELKMFLKGECGVVQFVLFTHWHLPQVQAELLSKCRGYNGHNCSMQASAADLGYHSPKPIREGDTPISDNCRYLDGRPCYYDGSSLAAERIFKVLVAEGDAGVWRELETYYKELFGEEE